jgi:hypothetical protein
VEQEHEEQSQTQMSHDSYQARQVTAHDCGSSYLHGGYTAFVREGDRADGGITRTIFAARRVLPKETNSNLNEVQVETSHYTYFKRSNRSKESSGGFTLSPEHAKVLARALLTDAEIIELAASLKAGS